jgi:hypothetical protein
MLFDRMRDRVRVQHDAAKTRTMPDGKTAMARARSANYLRASLSRTRNAASTTERA